jgi:hypothetical protein
MHWRFVAVAVMVLMSMDEMPRAVWGNNLVSEYSHHGTVATLIPITDHDRGVKIA